MVWKPGVDFLCDEAYLRKLFQDELIALIQE
jgi:hypothetical protein